MFLQIGSYYGCEIAPVDIDGDGITDNLLVAAPMFFSGGLEKGKVYIYRVTELVGINYKNKHTETHTGIESVSDPATYYVELGQHLLKLQTFLLIFNTPHQKCPVSHM